MLTQSRLKELLTYDPTTGVFCWLCRRGNQGGGPVAVGQLAGSIYSTGYRVISLEGKRYGAHRLAFLYMTGAFPPDMVDHINGDRMDNRWCNLRPANHSQNNANKPTKNKHGAKGVKQTKYGRFQADIRVGGKKKYLGTFDTVAEAKVAYKKAANLVFGTYANIA